MLCPACLTFGTNRDATTVVGGTQFCNQHGIEALAQDGTLPATPLGPMPGVRGQRPVRPERRFSPPVDE